MKRILAVIFSILILTLCCACGTSKPTLEGEWYHIDTGYLYKFQDGRILCEDNYWEIRKGHKISGLYETHENNSYKAHIKDIKGYELLNNIYIVKFNDTFALSSTQNQSGELLFIKSKEEANKLRAEREKTQKLLLSKIELEHKLLYDTKPTFSKHRTINANISKDFNEATNDTLILNDIELSLPKKWETNIIDGIIGVSLTPYIETPPIFSLIFFNLDNDVNFLNLIHRKDLADSIIKYYKYDLYKNKIESLELLNCYASNKSDYLYIGCKGKIYSKEYFGLIKVRHLGNGLCAFNLFQYTDSKYDFTNDMESIFDTLKSTKFKSYKHSTTNSKEEISSSGSTSDLDISCTKDYIDGNNMYLKVYVKNNSSAMFKGDVHVFFYSADGKKRLGSDMIIIDKLMPGQTSWAKVKIDKYLGTPKIETEFTNPQFIDVSPISAEVDTELSKKTSNSVRLNFDIASWYKNIESIEVYTDRTCVVKSNSTKDNSTIASAVWSCGKDHGVKSVQVVDTEGNIKAVYP